MKTCFTFLRSYYEAAQGLSDAEQLAFYDALMRYAFEGEEPELTGIVKGLFILAKQSIDTFE